MIAPLVALLVVVAALAARALRRRRAVPGAAWIEVDLGGSVHELGAHVPRIRRLLSRDPAVRNAYGLRRALDRAANDPRITGVLVRIEALACGWSTAMALRDALAAARAKGKRVIAFMPSGGSTRELYVASAAEKILATPQASIAPVGVSSGQTFFTKLLAKGGIEAEVLARREYKSAAESFVREGYSPENRTQLEALLDAVHREVVRSLAQARGKSEDEVARWIEEAPYRASKALELGMIDGLAYEDELAGLLSFKRADLVPLARYVWSTAPGLFARMREARGPRVGVVELRGSIVYEAQGGFGRFADVARTVGALRVARAAPWVGAVVLYVDSPGGSALASDLIAHEVARLREKKPVVAYFADVAASGGYYVAAPANEIVARPLSITGSIGVVMIRFVFERALEKLGLTHEVVRRGTRSDATSPYRHWTDDERAAFDREIEGMYGDFVDIVAKGRNKKPEEIEPLARGRVYAASDAHAVGLVDRLGGFDEAVARAEALANLTPGKSPVVVQAPRTTPDPAEPPAALQPILQRLGVRTELLNLALSSKREELFLFEDRVID